MLDTRTQIDHGIFGYCDAMVVTSELPLPPDGTSSGVLLDKARNIGRGIFPAAAPRHAA